MLHPQDVARQHKEAGPEKQALSTENLYRQPTEEEWQEKEVMSCPGVSGHTDTRDSCVMLEVAPPGLSCATPSCLSLLTPLLHYACFYCYRMR